MGTSREPLAAEDAALVLTAEALEHLREFGRGIGVAQLGAVALDDPGFVPAREAFDEHLSAGRHGDMAFMERTAEVRKHPETMLAGARTALVAVIPYGGEAGPVARYAQSADYHTEIHHRLEGLTEELNRLLPGARSLIAVDTKPVLERAAAVLAGHGFIGKHGCVIVPGLGSYVLLGEILTTAVWRGEAEARPLSKLRWDACGSCTACLDACPTQAFVKPGVLDPRRCISYLTIEYRGRVDASLEDQLGERIVGCDVCQEVCPYNASAKRETRRTETKGLPAPPPRALDASLEELATIGSARYRAFVRGTAVRRIPRRAMRRNVLLALGNREGPPNAVETAAMEACAADPEPLVAEAAQRALLRRASSPKK